jgi:hypothetical protein
MAITAYRGYGDYRGLQPDKMPPFPQVEDFDWEKYNRPLPKRILAVDFNDQHHVIRREFGDRRLKVGPMLECLPKCDILMAFAKAPSDRVVDRFDHMLKYKGFEVREYLLGRPKWQDCMTMLACYVLAAVMATPPKEMIIVSSHPDVEHLTRALTAMGITSRVYGFGTNYPFPLHCLDPTPMYDQLELTDVAQATKD